MTTLTEQEIQRNMRDVAHAIAQQELEGLKVSKATVEDMQRLIQDLGYEPHQRNNWYQLLN